MPYRLVQCTCNQDTDFRTYSNVLRLSKNATPAVFSAVYNQKKLTTYIPRKPWPSLKKMADAGFLNDEHIPLVHPEQSGGLFLISVEGFRIGPMLELFKSLTDLNIRPIMMWHIAKSQKARYHQSREIGSGYFHMFPAFAIQGEGSAVIAQSLVINHQQSNPNLSSYIDQQFVNQLAGYLTSSQRLLLRKAIERLTLNKHGPEWLEHQKQLSKTFSFS